MSRLSHADKIQPDWWGKTLAGVILGLALSFGIVGLFAWVGSDGLMETLTPARQSWRTQFSMWMISPIWLLILSFVFMFKNSKQAVLWLGGANLVVYVILFVVRGMA
ncbi:MULTISPECIES: hypothetical protein [Pseudoalteromonas]|uniref:hypothetical protein n=1 Tax=Pseudoalteromonas TaxID=53246 RepID=UPI000C7A9DEB|nr:MULTISPECIES: hypothetical protein [Pseudoalteromonas]AUJ71873.1 hypothetical protein PNC201_18280 [Pseudoalteromonas sp. NC201]MCF2828994.1 hypothetical protein [Pseudoalteromonas sp. OF5H-5]MCF2831874.1 hypothetical protein [Pseudoalteromonas sp. DL2-H6]MCF2926300.1 hypothetical protein [Pseudoalteromonas sp. DL2-H1]MCF7513643.1 hypothetical protein [Pseudoalteromonas sp. L7]